VWETWLLLCCSVSVAMTRADTIYLHIHTHTHIGLHTMTHRSDVLKTKDERPSNLLHAQYLFHCPTSIIHMEVAIGWHPPTGISYELVLRPFALPSLPPPRVCLLAPNNHHHHHHINYFKNNLTGVIRQRIVTKRF